MKLSPFQMMKRKEGRRRETLVLLVLKAQKERERVEASSTLEQTSM